MKKFALFRHEKSLGNSAEHTIGLYKHLVRNDIKDFEIYVETEFQKYFALCIPFVKPENIKFFPEEHCHSNLHLTEYSKDFYFPNVYREEMSYPAGWADLTTKPDVTLTFPNYYYKNKKKLPKNAILLQVREANTFDKRVVGANEEPQRFVNVETFFELAEYYANKGYTVVRLGDKNQTPFPKHNNIIDFAMEKNKTMMDDLYMINNCKCFISCDSGIWPMAVGMKKNLVLCNITSPLNLSRAEFFGKNLLYKFSKSAIIDWLPKKTTELLFKKPDKDTLRPLDNIIDEIIKATERFL